MSSVLTKKFQSSEAGIREFINNPRIVKRSFVELLALDSISTKIEKIYLGVWSVKNYDNGNAIIIYLASYTEYPFTTVRKFNDFETYMLSEAELLKFSNATKTVL